LSGRGPDRIGLHEAKPLERVLQRSRREEAAGGRDAETARDSLASEPHPSAFLVLVLFEPSGFGWQHFAKDEV
jgi:hypothetical protein